MAPLIVVLIGAGIALILVQTGVVTSTRLISAIYAILGGVLGIMILRFIVGPLGPISGIIGAVLGAVILLYFARPKSKGDD